MTTTDQPERPRPAPGPRAKRLVVRGVATVLGVALVALTAMKELPATLLLRPTGMDTLATRLWNATSVGRYAEAAPYALTLVLLAAVPTWVVVHRTGIVAAVRGRSSAPSTPNEVSE